MADSNAIGQANPTGTSSPAQTTGNPESTALWDHNSANKLTEAMRQLTSAIGVLNLEANKPKATKGEAMSDYVSRGELDAKLQSIENTFTHQVELIHRDITSLTKTIEKAEKSSSEDKKEFIKESSALRRWLLGSALTLVFGFLGIVYFISNTALTSVNNSNSAMKDIVNAKIEAEKADTDLKLQKQKDETLSDIKGLLIEMNKKKK